MRGENRQQMRCHEARACDDLAYVVGVSTRRVGDLVGTLGIAGISKSEVSRICAALDATKAMARLDGILVRGHKGSDRAPWSAPRQQERPDPSSERAESAESGTAFRIPSETSHASQPRSRRTTRRRMRL